MGNSNFAKLIQENFIIYSTPTSSDVEIAESNVRLAYKLRAPGGGVIKKVNDYRNAIIRIEESNGIDESGVMQACLLISIDFQHYYDPDKFPKDVDIITHYEFAWGHLKSVVIPEFERKGIEGDGNIC